MPERLYDVARLKYKATAVLGALVWLAGCGGASSRVAVPDLAQQPLAQAAKHLKQDGLCLGLRLVADERPDAVALRVLRQSPLAGTVVRRGSRVALTVRNSPLPRRLVTGRPVVLTVPLYAQAEGCPALQQVAKAPRRR